MNFGFLKKIANLKFKIKIIRKVQNLKSEINKRHLPDLQCLDMQVNEGY